MQHTVDAVAHAKVVLGGLEVDVGRAVLDGLRDEQVDVPDDWGVLGDLPNLREVLFLLPCVELGGEVVELLTRAVIPVDGGHDVVARRDDRLDVDVAPLTRDLLDVIDGEHIRGVGHGHDELAVVEADRDRGVPAGHVAGHPSQGGAIHRLLAEVDEAHADLRG